MILIDDLVPREQVRIKRYIDIVKLTQGVFYDRKQIAQLTGYSYNTLFHDLEQLTHKGILVTELRILHSHIRPSTFYKSAPDVKEYPVDEFVTASDSRLMTMASEGTPAGPKGKGIKDDQPLTPFIENENPHMRKIYLSSSCSDAPNYLENFQKQQKDNAEARKKKLRAKTSFTGIGSSMGMFQI